jgi:hypothetical protein
MNDEKDMTVAMSCYWYEQWYLKEISPHLDWEQKVSLAKRIGNLSEEIPIFEPGFKFPKKDFPEIEKYVRTDELTGIQLYATLMMIATELPEMPPGRKRASEIAGKPILPDLPR